MMGNEQHQDVWTFTENAPDYAEKVANLWHWSTNYDAGRGPFTLFLDLIGWSEENLGEPLAPAPLPNYGYVELSKLADALTQYADQPHNVRAWVDELMGFDEA